MKGRRVPPEQSVGDVGARIYFCARLVRSHLYSLNSVQLILISIRLFIKIQEMTDTKGMQLFDKVTRNRIFNSLYWKDECFALNAQTLIDKAIKIKYVGGLYSGAKKPTKFLCLVFKMLQMNLPREIVMEYLKARQYKYLTAMSLMYLRLITKGAEVYEILEPFYNDNRKLRLRDSIGSFSIIHIDEFADKLLVDEIFLGINLPFIQKRIVLEEQELIQPRVSMLEYEQNEDAIEQQDQEEQK